MKKIFIVTVILISFLACKKTKFSPEGPTDVRVRNISDLTFNDVTVNTSGITTPVGNIGPDLYSEYFRFEKAYPKAEITATVNGILFTTGSVNSSYMQYLGQDRITYVVYISSMDSKELKIHDVIVEEPLVLK